MGNLKIFENKKVRREWDAEREDWLMSVVDVVGALTDQPDFRGASNYWAKLKERLKSEGNELLTICQQLKMIANDGKMRMTDVATDEGILRIIQSIPSPKAEPFKLWLAKVGAERLDEIADPELAIDRAFQTYYPKTPSSCSA